MSLVSKLPREIITNIYEMNPEHREYFSKIQKEIEMNGISSRLHYIRKLAEYKDADDEYVMINKVNDYDYMIRKLNECKCCKRHCKNKPKCSKDKGTYTNGIPRNKIEALFSKKCQCPCRHNSRWLFDIFTESPPEYEDYDDDEFNDVFDYLHDQDLPFDSDSELDD